MTEAEWLASENPQAMFSPRVRLHPRFVRRIAVLFAVACIRATDGTDKQRRLWWAVEAAERGAEDGEWAEVDRLRRAASAACGKVRQASAAHYWALAARFLTEPGAGWPIEVPDFLVRAVAATAEPGGVLRDRALSAPAEPTQALRRSYADILRDIFGNPFRPVVFDPAWRTSAAVALAGAMYESRNFGNMPILGDALDDAGCDNADVLAHCRDEKQVHVRGCWVVDLVLGK
jgi:hypothetical protein